MLAIIGGIIHTITNGICEKGTVLIENGKICNVGSNLEIPAHCQLVHAEGKLIFPGFIDAHCHMGILEEIYREGDDVNESSDPLTPHLQALDAINPDDLSFKDALSAGVTTVAIGPGSANVVGGKMVAVKTAVKKAGNIIDQMVISNPVGIKAALGENPKRIHGNEKRAPLTRMANAALLRQALTECVHYQKKSEKEINFKNEALIPVIEGRLPLRVHAHRADDIVTAVRIGEEFGIKIVIEHGTEGYKVADFLAEKNIPVIVGPIIANRCKVEMQDITIKNAHFLSKAGVKIAVMTDHPEVPIHFLPLSAALTVKGGLSEEEALKAITIYPAEILGLNKHIGSIEKGKDADLIILNRAIFDVRCQVEAVYVNGKNYLQNWQE